MRGQWGYICYIYLWDEDRPCTTERSDPLCLSTEGHKRMSAALPLSTSIRKMGGGGGGGGGGAGS